MANQEHSDEQGDTTPFYRAYDEATPAYAPSGKWENRLDETCPKCGKAGTVHGRGAERMCAKCPHKWVE